MSGELELVPNSLCIAHQEQLPQNAQPSKLSRMLDNRTGVESMLRTFNDFDTDPDIYAARRQGGGHGFAGIQLPLLRLDEV